MDYFVLTVASLILFAATFFSTVTGFGFALIAAPVLTLVMGPKETVVFVIVAGVIVRVIMMWRTWGQFEWSTVLITAGGSLLGIIPGAYLLKVADANHLKILLGVALLLVTLLMELNFVPEVRNKKLGRVSAGFLSGFFSATTSISGPPIALYFLSENMEKNLLRANMIWIFAIGSFCTLGSFCGGHFSGRQFNCFVAVCAAGGAFRLVVGRKNVFSDQPAFIQTHCAAGGVDRRSDDTGQWYQWRAALNLL